MTIKLFLTNDQHHRDIMGDYIKHGLYLQVEDKNGLHKFEVTEKGKRIQQALRKLTPDKIDAEYDRLKRLS